MPSIGSGRIVASEILFFKHRKFDCCNAAFNTDAPERALDAPLGEIRCAWHGERGEAIAQVSRRFFDI
ncbi:MAG: hypothetical protein ACTHNZ_02565 [Trinickia sp.]|uniref:hypothetical protein n=1 Tax=Trinickia sp. TaxID=2571163 RepID=UPI003F7F3DE6